MNRVVKYFSALLVVLAVTNVHAVPLQDLFNGATLTAGNYQFEDWELINQVDPNAGPINLSDIEVVVVGDGTAGNAYGVSFIVINDALRVTGDDFLNLWFRFSVTISDPTERITGSSMIGTVETSGNQHLVVLEKDIYNFFTSDHLAFMEIYSDPLDVPALDLDEVTTLSSQTRIWVEDNIFVDGIGGFAELQTFTQRFESSPLLDSDNDGVADNDDQCANTAAAAIVDGNGCSDAQVDVDSDGTCDPGASSVGPSVCTGSDNCPVDPNPGQANTDGDTEGDACDSDDDNDGDLDVDDNCPLIANPDQANNDNDTEGDVCDVDDDNDGVDDDFPDNCPLDANPGQEDNDNDGIGDVCDNVDDNDDDNDGVPNSTDNCILVPNPLQEDTNGDGFGNFCDGDFDNNGIVNLADLAMMRAGFFGTNNPDLDMNGDGTVNFADLLLFKNGFFLTPGPAAPTNSAIDIEKATNGVDADDPNAGDAPQIAPGSLVSWTYVVTNTGDTTLNDIVVTDDQGLAVSCPQVSLASGDSMVCSASGLAEDLNSTGFTTVPGLCGAFPNTPLYENMGQATGQSASGDFVQDVDPSHYCNPAIPAIDIEKATNGVDADDPNAGDAPQIAPGNIVSWTYVVTNTGNTTLVNVGVTDDQGVVVSCPQDTLSPGESMICTASGIADDLNNTAFTTVPGLCGQNPNTPLYENMGQATGQSASGDFVQDVDPSHYCNPAIPAIDIEKATNGVDADDPNAGDAPQIAPGNLVTWTYVVTNTGNTTLNDVVVTDDQGVVVSCPQDTLSPGESMICTASGIADDLNNTAFTTVPGLCGQNPNTPLYENMGQATGQSASGDFVQDVDPSHYCNPAIPAIDIEKATNGVDADDPNAGDAPQIAPGNIVSWTYVVTNTGNTTLNDVVVTDDQGVAVSCPQGTLSPGQSMICTASGLAEDLNSTGFTTVPGLCGSFPNTPLYENMGRATATSASGEFVEDIDPSHYCNPAIPAIDIEKATNGVDADDPNAGDAPQIAPGNLVTWTYVVTNTGNTTLNDVVVTDDQGVVVSCPQDTLSPGESMICTASGIADDLNNTAFTTVPGLCGQNPNTPLYENMGQATGQSASGQFVQDVDPSHYCNPAIPAIDIEKATNGVDADDPNAGDAPQIAPGSLVSWTYVVTNTGDTTLINVGVTDDQGVPVACPQDTLSPGESMICTASGLADDLNNTAFTTVPGLCGQNPNTPLYENMGQATATSASGEFVEDIDPSHYCNPVIPAIDIEKATNGVDADDPNAGDAPQIAPGNIVSWTYVVTNTGNTTLNDVVVTDDQGVPVACPQDTLAPGESMICTASGLADDLSNTAFTTVPGLCGQNPNTPLYENMGQATGQSASGQFVQDVDPSHYCNPVIAAIGDFNGDDLLDCVDLDALGAEIAAGTNDPAFDLTGDGLVNLADRDAWLDEAGTMNTGSPYVPGDANLDGVVDPDDYFIWDANKFTVNPSFCAGDFNSDGVVDGSDFIIWNLAAGGFSCPVSATVFRGIQVGGTLQSFCDLSGTADYNPGSTMMNPSEAPVWLILERTAPSGTGFSSFIVNAETDTTLTPGLTVTYTVEFWNFDTATYEVVANDGSPSFVSATGDLSRFVEPGTNTVRTRLGWRDDMAAANMDPGANPWLVKIELAAWFN